MSVKTVVLLVVGIIKTDHLNCGIGMGGSANLEGSCTTSGSVNQYRPSRTCPNFEYMDSNDPIALLSFISQRKMHKWFTN